MANDQTYVLQVDDEPWTIAGIPHSLRLRLGESYDVTELSAGTDGTEHCVGATSDRRNSRDPWVCYKMVTPASALQRDPVTHTVRHGLFATIEDFHEAVNEIGKPVRLIVVLDMYLPDPNDQQAPIGLDLAGELVRSGRIDITNVFLLTAYGNHAFVDNAKREAFGRFRSQNNVFSKPTNVPHLVTRLAQAVSTVMRGE